MTPKEWFDALRWIDWALLISGVIVLALAVLGLRQAIRVKFVSKWSRGLLLALGVLLGIYLFYNLHLIEVADWAQIFLVGGLVAITGLYGLYMAFQARASVEMTEEMRQQRRPIVIPEVIPFEVETPKIHSTDYARGDIFKVRNVGNGPAIELQIMLLDKEKSHPQLQKKAILSQADAPLEFYPVDLENRVESTCYVVCQYRSVLSANVRQIWYETWLPFEPVKSQSGDRITIKPGELEFREDFKKKFY